MNSEADAIRIETERLLLVPARKDDLGDLNAMRNDPRNRRGLEPRPRESLEETAGKLETIIDDNRHGRGFNLAIRDAQSGHLLGMIGIWRLDLESGLGEIGYQLTADRWAEGLMREAMTAFINEVDRRLCGIRIEAFVDQDNAASLRLLRRHGFSPTGETSTEEEGLHRHLREPRES